MANINPAELAAFEQKLKDQHEQLTAAFEALQAETQDLQTRFKTAKVELQNFRAAYGDVIAAFEKRAAEETV